jgi:hypothetical protein
LGLLVYLLFPFRSTAVDAAGMVSLMDFSERLDRRRAYRVYVAREFASRFQLLSKIAVGAEQPMLVGVRVVLYDHDRDKTWVASFEVSSEVAVSAAGDGKYLARWCDTLAAEMSEPPQALLRSIANAIDRESAKSSDGIHYELVKPAAAGVAVLASATLSSAGLVGLMCRRRVNRAVDNS